MVWMGVEAQDKPATVFLRLKHCVRDERALASHRNELGDLERLLELLTLRHGLKDVPRELCVFAKCQQIEREDFVDVGHSGDGWFGCLQRHSRNCRRVAYLIPDIIERLDLADIGDC